MSSLGASDSVMAMLAVYYLAFPRQPIHVFRKLHLTSDAMLSLRKNTTRFGACVFAVIYCCVFVCKPEVRVFFFIFDYGVLD